MSRKIIDAQIKAYRDNFILHGDKPEGTFHNNPETRSLRYERLLKQFDTARPFSIHDIGSGSCDLHAYLLERNINHEYTGTEIVEEMVQHSKKKYPEIKVYNRDVINDNTIGKCNIVTTNALNLPGEIEQDEWKKFAFQLMRRMFEISDWGISVGFLTTHKTFTDTSLAYFNPCELFDYCAINLSRFIVVDHAYPLYEGTITVFHEQYFIERYKASAFIKYFR